MSIFGGINRAAGMMGSQASREALARQRYLAAAQAAGGVPPIGVPAAQTTRRIPGVIVDDFGRKNKIGSMVEDLFGKRFGRVGAGTIPMNREAYLDMADMAGGLPAMASGRRMLDRFAAEDAARARGNAGPNALSSALNRIAGNFVEDDGGLQIIPGLINTGMDVQRGIQDAAGNVVMGGVRAAPRVARGAYNAGRGAVGLGKRVLGGIAGGLF